MRYMAVITGAVAVVLLAATAAKYWPISNVQQPQVQPAQTWQTHPESVYSFNFILDPNVPDDTYSQMGITQERDGTFVIDLGELADTAFADIIGDCTRCHQDPKANTGTR